jgi:hypothetical protein
VAAASRDDVKKDDDEKDNVEKDVVEMNDRYEETALHCMTWKGHEAIV